MATRIRYMGNKHDVAPVVADLVRRRRRVRPFIDLFCGMCSVGGAVAQTGRRVVGNDIQRFAALVARCLIATTQAPPSREDLIRALHRSYRYNQHRLRERFGDEIAREDRILRASDARGYRRAYPQWRHAANDQEIAAELAAIAANGDARPYRLATLSFAWGYFGLRQAIAIDSIRFAIDRARETERLSEAGADWALVALIQAASCASASPGHFAQYLRPTGDEGFVRILRQRRRDIWRQFLFEASQVEPYGSEDWRGRNSVFESDALGIWAELDKLGLEDGIVYADPPYSKDHYSRYYHVLETLVRYDHPSAAGKGRYRPDRFATPFSRKTDVEHAMGRLCTSVAERGWTLILSYPSIRPEPRSAQRLGLGPGQRSPGTSPRSTLAPPCRAGSARLRRRLRSGDRRVSACVQAPLRSRRGVSVACHALGHCGGHLAHQRALLLSRVQASAAELSRRTFAADEHQARRTGLL